MAGFLSMTSFREVDPQERGRMISLIVLLAGIIFALDLVIPLGIDEPDLYVLVVLISLRLPYKKDTLVIATGCTVLTLLGILFSPEGSELWMVMTNRGLAIFAIWVVAILALQVKESSGAIQAKGQMLNGILSNMPAVAFQLDEEGYMTESVGKGLRRIGLKEQESVGRNALEPPARLKAELEKAEPGQTIFYESQGVHMGHPWWFLNCLTPNSLGGKGGIGFGIDITDLKKAERRLAAHHAVTEILAQSKSLSDATLPILEAICGSVAWPVGAIWHVDRERDVLRCVEIWHRESINLEEFEAQTKATTFKRGVGLPGRVWESGEPAWIMDVVKDPNFPRAPFAAKEGLHAAFGFPIKIGDQIVGVMEFFNREVQDPDEELLKMFATIGSQIGQFAERQWVEQRLEMHHAVTNVLADSKSLPEATPHLLEAICESLSWPFGAIWHVDGEQDVLRCVEIWHRESINLEEFVAQSKATTFKPGVGLPGRVWESGKPAWIMDVVKDPNFPRAPFAAKEGLHAAFGFPIKMGDQIVGVMEFFNREVQEPDEELLKMLGVVGIQIGQFIQGAQV